MIKMRQMAIAALTVLTVAACGKTEDVAAVAVSESTNALFAYVPADTPYLLGNLEPLSNEVIDTFLLRVQPVLNTVQTELHQARETLEARNTSDAETPGVPGHEEFGAKLMLAVLQEFDGKLNRKGIEGLGFDLQSHKVMYGMGAFPVIRVGLSDADALRETIQRVLDRAGVTATELNHEGTAYWRLSDGDASQQPAGLYLAILETHLAIGLFPPLAEAELLPQFLGQTMPAESNAAMRLAELNAKHGYTPFGSGIFDLNRMFDEFVTPGTTMARAMAAGGEVDVTDMPAECESEIRSIISKTPRFTLGTTELSVDAIAMQYRIEAESTLAQQLAGLVAEIPMADPLSRKILEFSFGMRFGAVRDFLRTQAAAIMESPFQCEHLLDLNHSASEAFAQLNQPMPPFVNNFRGVRLSLNEITMENSIPNGATGLAAVHVEQPEMFVGMAQMFLPDLSGLTLAPGDPPVQVPASMLPMPGLVAFAALSDEAIGLSLGAGEESGLPDYLAQKPGPAGTFLSTSYDMAAYLDYSQKLSEPYQDMAMTDDMDPAYAAHRHSYIQIQKSAQDAFKAFSDRSELTLRFTSEGFVADSRMTFK